MSADHDGRLARIDSRNEFALRRKTRDAEETADFIEFSVQVVREVKRLLAEYPHLEGEAPDRLFCRYITAETAPDFASVLRRNAFALLHLRAVDRAEQASPFTGGEAA